MLVNHLLNIVKILKKITETGNLKHLCRNELDKACFAHDVAYSDGKYLGKRTISDKTLKDRAFEIARNCKYNGYPRALAIMVYKYFDKKAGLGVSENNKLAEELNKTVMKKFKRRKVYARFKDNIWGADFAEMESLSSKNKNVKYLLFVTDIFTKYAWVKPLQDKKDKKVLNAFIKTVHESIGKPNKLWVDQGKEFYKKLM